MTKPSTGRPRPGRRPGSRRARRRERGRDSAGRRQRPRRRRREVAPRGTGLQRRKRSRQRPSAGPSSSRSTSSQRTSPRSHMVPIPQHAANRRVVVRRQAQEIPHQSERLRPSRASGNIRVTAMECRRAFYRRRPISCGSAERVPLPIAALHRHVEPPLLREVADGRLSGLRPGEIEALPDIALHLAQRPRRRPSATLRRRGGSTCRCRQSGSGTLLRAPSARKRPPPVECPATLHDGDPDVPSVLRRAGAFRSGAEIPCAGRRTTTRRSAARCR